MGCDKGAGYVAHLHSKFDIREPVTKAHDCVEGQHEYPLVEKLHSVAMLTLKGLDVRKNED